MKVSWLILLFFLPCGSFANEQTETEGHELPIATGAPFSGADQVFNLGKQHGQLLRAQIVKMYCSVAKCNEAMSKEENQHE
ncbi:hypothetical protein [Vibrio vulnificus]|uniref:hypothetical protein n=1 Tax=Vibrio vulnificus TaxID=672 RepID=UPI003ED8B538